MYEKKSTEQNYELFEDDQNIWSQQKLSCRIDVENLICSGQQM